MNTAKNNIVIQIHMDDGIRTALLTTVGPKWLSMIWPDSSGMKIHRVKRSNARYTKLDYSPKHARKLLRQCAARFGITKAARKALKG